MTNIFDLLSEEKLRQLKDYGFVVVHRVPINSILKAGRSALGYHDGDLKQSYHRMVAESIRLQNKTIERLDGLTDEIEKA